MSRSKPIATLLKTSVLLGLSTICLSGYSQLLFDDGEFHEVDFNATPSTEDYIDVFDSDLGEVTTVAFIGGSFSGNHQGIGNSPFSEADLSLFESSEAIIAGATFENDVVAAEDSTLYMESGRIKDDVYVIEGALAVFEGGQVDDDINVYEYGTVVIFGGAFGEDIEANHAGQIFISGGTFGVNPDPDSGFDSGFGAYDDGMITLFGSNFKIDDTAVGDSVLTAGDISEDTILSGVLEDGSAFSMPIAIEGFGSITLIAVPEPSTYLVVFGMLGALFTYKRKRSNT